jgi:[NiFe] hydrogenase assembly HybE family chaperone
MICPEYLTAGLEAAFTRIQRERMADVPILNPDLEVQAVGFRIWEERCLGVLITPWFMNLMLLPLDSDDWAGQSSGNKVKHVFPSGHYEFMVGEEDGIGHYQMCSLFSPVFEFQTQDAAIATAEAVMDGLMDEANRDDVSTREAEILTIWSGEDAVTGVVVAEDQDENLPTLKERIEKPMGRRDMLRGAFLRREG